MKQEQKWWYCLQTRQDFIDALPMFAELDGIMTTALYISRTLPTQTKQRFVIKQLKSNTNIPLKRIKEIVKGKIDNDLDLTYANYMYMNVCEENGYMDGIYGLDGLSEEGKQSKMFFDYWNSL
jgi:hypothetical protein